MITSYDKLLLDFKLMAEQFEAGHDYTYPFAWSSSIETLNVRNIDARTI